MAGMGIDALSMDRGQSKEKMTHRIMNGNNTYGLENLKNLDKIPTKDFTAFVLPLNIRGGSGSPVRVFVLTEPLHVYSFARCATTPSVFWISSLVLWLFIGLHIL